MGLYVEARIRAGMDVLWERSQVPARHRRWDLRFTHIDYLPRVDGEPQRFRYAVRVLPGLLVAGSGVSAGERRRPDGTRTSVLRFASSHPLAFLIRGQGYWRYIPDGGAVRFLTGYDYAPRWGPFGRFADRVVFRPLMGWATAWSFDRLRLWCERGITPERALWRGLAEVAARLLGVAAAAMAGAVGAGVPLAAVCGVAASAAAVVVPPLPGTPAARRCLRRPPSRAAPAHRAPGRAPARTAASGTVPDGAVPPALLDRLEP